MTKGVRSAKKKGNTKSSLLYRVWQLSCRRRSCSGKTVVAPTDAELSILDAKLSLYCTASFTRQRRHCEPPCSEVTIQYVYAVCMNIV